MRGARAIDAGFADGGDFDLPSWQQWAVEQVYEYPSPDVRKAFADEFAGADDKDIQESLLYTSAAFDYMIWNRAVQTTWSERQVIFAELAGAAGDDVDDDA